MYPKGHNNKSCGRNTKRNKSCKSALLSLATESGRTRDFYLDINYY